MKVSARLTQWKYTDEIKLFIYVLLFKLWLVWENEEIGHLQGCEYSVLHYSWGVFRLWVIIWHLPYQKLFRRKMSKRIGNSDIKIDLNIDLKRRWYGIRLKSSDLGKVNLEMFTNNRHPMNFYVRYIWIGKTGSTTSHCGLVNLLPLRVRIKQDVEYKDLMAMKSTWFHRQWL